MGKNNHEIAEIAANWWGDVIQNPKFDNGPPEDGLACIFGPVLAHGLVKEIPPVTKEIFIKKLTEVIEKMMLRNEGRGISFGVDYHPDRVLAGVAKEAGVSENNFPWKTWMWVDKNSVAVAYGYRASQELLYTNKVHWENEIQSAEDAIKEYQNGRYNKWLTAEDNAKRIKQLKEDITNYRKLMDEAMDEAEE